MNVWTFSGNLGADAEQKDVGESKLLVFNVAVNSGYGDKKAITWARCNLWGNRGDKLLPYLMKGTKVIVSGEITLKEWKTETKHGASMEVRVNEVTLIGSKSEAKEEPKEAPINDDGIPF